MSFDDGFEATEGGALTLPQAYTILGLADTSKGVLGDVKAAYRKLCLRWHPDKNPSDKQHEAKDMFTKITNAYHTITTANFDYERWAKSYEIPPMQSLEDVLKMALSGVDPYEVENVMRMRGEWRPAPTFGVDVNVPWSAGTKSDPSFNVQTGSGYNNTKKIGHGGDSYSQQFALPSIGTAHDRPWERVGGVGFEEVSLSLRGGARKLQLGDGVRIKNLRPDLDPADVNSTELTSAAETLNDEALGYFSSKEYEKALVAYDECCRLKPNVPAYLGNRAAVLLKVKDYRNENAKKAVADLEKAVAIDQSYVRGFIRLGQALFTLGDDPGKEDSFDVRFLKRSEHAFEKALALDPANKIAKKTLEDVRISLQLYED
mmetsp:Transcript_7214/g.27158  ORF Transcript_7214/g.27158 Transcript_7214/m.27158 type:complete len:374 (-) Transcript_7214:57-1178(-)